MHVQLMVCEDGVQVEEFDLEDGNDAANAELEREAFDLAYELKEREPGNVVSIVVCHIDAPNG